MTYTWDDFPLLTPAPGTRPPRHIKVGRHHYSLLPDNGWGTTIAWEAGPRLAGRVPDHPSTHTVTERYHDHNRRETTRRTVPRTEDDQRLIEEFVNDYLAEAGIPPRPHGFAWYLQDPPAHTGLNELTRAINQQDTTGHPTHIRLITRTALARFYPETP